MNKEIGVATKATWAPSDYAGALVVTGGGTGGHFFPAQALAEGWQLRHPQQKIVMIGAHRGIEAKHLPQLPFAYELLHVEGFVGRSPWRLLTSLFLLWRSVRHLRRQWKQHRPQAVIGTGGYAAAPALRAAVSLGIPIYLHESNAAPGKLIDWMAPRAQRVWCGMKEVQDRLPQASCLIVGTPVRAAFRRSFSPIKTLTAPYQLLVLGGSGGARAINQAMMKCAPLLLEAFPNWIVLHQVGARDFPYFSQLDHHPRHHLVPFIEAMDQTLEQTSLVISRSGASICAELKASGRGSILIPFPRSAGDHQRRNAESLAREDRSILVLEQNPLEDFIEAHASSHMRNAYARHTLAKTPELNRAVELCLEDLEQSLGLASAK